MKRTGAERFVRDMFAGLVLVGVCIGVAGTGLIVLAAWLVLR